MPEFYDQEQDRTPSKPHPFPKGFPITADYRDMGPTLECLCGSDGFYILAIFEDDRSVAGYYTDGMCADCGALVKVPTQADEDPFDSPIEFDELLEPPMNLPGWESDTLHAPDDD